METIKKQAFTIILVVVTLGLGGGAVLGLTRPYLKQNRERIGQADSLGNQLKDLRTRGQNQKSVTEVTEFGTKLDAEVKGAIEAAGQLNRQGRKSLTLSVRALGNKMIDLFPVDRETYSRGYVPEQFSDEYDKVLLDLLARLKGATPPSNVEVEAMARRIAMLLGQQDPATAQTVTTDLLPMGITEASQQGAAFMGGRGGEMGERGMMMGGEGRMGGEGGMRMMRPPTSPLGQTGQTGPAGAVPTEEAMKYLQLQQINNRERPIYADVYSFYFYRPTGTSATILDTWKAMVCYWIQEYVVNSIQNINGTALERRNAMENGKLDLTIASAAIKRLVRVNLGQNGDVNLLYGGEVGGGPGGATGGGGMAMGGEGGGRMGMGGEGGMIGMGPAPSGGTGGGAATLTGHESNLQYDVVRFGLSLVVRTDDLPLVLEELQNRPGYTVLKVDVADVNMPLPAPAGMQAGLYRGAAQDLQQGPAGDTSYYYGADPVVLVQLDMEARLDCSWERPMMPKEMLARLPATALRPEDSAAMNPSDTPGAPVSPEAPGGFAPGGFAPGGFAPGGLGPPAGPG